MRPIGPMACLVLLLGTPPAQAEPIGWDFPAAAHGALHGDVQIEGGEGPPPGLVLTVQAEAGPALPLAVSADGAFVLDPLTPGPYTLSAEAPGHYPVSVGLLVKEGVDTTVNLRLLPVVVGGDAADATIIAEEAAGPAALQSRAIVKEALRTQAGTGGDPLRAVQALPGVARAPFSSGLILIRGTGPQESGFYLEGAPIPEVYHWGGLCALVPAEALTAITLLPGADSVRYGGHLGGVVELDLDTSLPDKHQGMAAADLFQASTWIRQPIGDHLGLSLSARRSYYDAILQPLAEASLGEGVAVQTPRYWDALGQLSFDGGGFSGALLGRIANDGVSVPTSTGETLEVGLLSAQGLFTMEGPRLGTLRPRLQAWTGPTRRSLTLPGGDHAGEATVRSGGRLELLRPVGDGQSLGLFAGLTAEAGSTGFDYFVNDLGYLGYSQQRRPEIGNASISNVAGYGELTQRWGPVDLITGARAARDTIGAYSFFTVDPRAAARLRLPHTVLVWTSVGRTHQLPAPRELLARTWGRPDLSPETALALSLGATATPAAGLELSLTGWRSRLEDRIVGHEDRFELIPGLLPSPTADTRPYENAGSGRTEGVEAMGTYTNEQTQAAAILSLSRSLRTDRDGVTAPFLYDQPFAITLSATQRLPRRYTIGGRLRLTAGLPYFDSVNHIYLQNAQTWAPVATSTDPARLPPWVALDLRAEKAWPLRKRATLSATADIMNATNRKNAEAVNYSADWTTVRPVYGLPLVPALGLRVDW